MIGAGSKQVRQFHLRPDETNVLAQSLCKSYTEFCKRFLPLSDKAAKWRYSRAAKADDLEQGWKLHLSATILTANEMLEKVAPFLCERGVLFKAPCSLQELSQINCGLFYGYSQVGKFITIYPGSDQEAVSLAGRLHELTIGMAAPRVPFDRRFQTGSCVHYRYGAFTPIKIKDSEGVLSYAIKDPEGKLVPDSREVVSPKWVADPFINKESQRKPKPIDSPLKTTFRAFRALSQRGKGGVYQALDFSVSPPRLCLLKQGRAEGEVSWDGRDGRWLVKNEQEVLTQLRSSGIAVPRIYSSFELGDHYYLVTEFIEGDDLQTMLSRKRRRLAIAQALRYGIQLSLLISQIHAAGWVWRDCKPSNLMVTKKGELRPVDFEGACRINSPDPLDWYTADFTLPECRSADYKQANEKEDLYTLGAVIYYLITGKLPQAPCFVPMTELRRNVPDQVCDIVSELLARDHHPNGQTVARRLNQALETLDLPQHLLSPVPCLRVESSEGAIT